MKKIHFISFFLVSIVYTSSVQAQTQHEKRHKMFVDTTDNALDISNWLGTVSGFVPLIMPITEPALGYGAGGGLVFYWASSMRIHRGSPAAFRVVLRLRRL